MTEHRGNSHAASLADRGQRLDLVAVLYVPRLLCASLVALPLSSALMSAGVARHPHGDARLFASGAVYLVESLRLALPALVAAIGGAAWLLALCSGLSVLPLTAVVRGLLHPGEPIKQTTFWCLPLVPRFLLLGGLGFLLQACALCLALLCASLALHSVANGNGSAAGDFAFAAVLTVGLLSACVIGVTVDLARAASATFDLTFARSLETAMALLVRRPFGVLVQYFVPATLCISAALLMGLAVSELHIERGESWRVWLVFAVHQAVIVLTCSAEVLWQRSALRLVLTPPGKHSTDSNITASADFGTASDSAAPLYPS